MKTRILPEVRRKRWFTPPSEVRRLEKQKAIRKARQAARRRERRNAM
jgi:ribosomal protein S21